MSEDKDALLRSAMLELYPPGKQIRTFVEAVLVRPHMYTLNGTFEEAIVFLQGFYNGMSAHNKHPKVQAEADRWFAFVPYLAQHINHETSTSWFDVFPAFRRMHSDDVRSLIQLMRLWYAFCNQYNDGDNINDD